MLTDQRAAFTLGAFCVFTDRIFTADAAHSEACCIQRMLSLCPLEPGVLHQVVHLAWWRIVSLRLTTIQDAIARKAYPATRLSNMSSISSEAGAI